MKLKEKTNHWMRLKYIYILPLTVASLVTFAQPKTFVENTEVLESKSSQTTTVQNTKDPTTSGKKKSKSKKNDDDDKIYRDVDQNPEFPGGVPALKKYLERSIKYPIKAMDTDTQGRVVAQFVINKKGKIDNVRIVKSVSPELDAEAIRVVKAMPKWKPGKNKGKAVNTAFTMPIQFKLK